MITELNLHSYRRDECEGKDLNYLKIIEHNYLNQMLPSLLDKTHVTVIKENILKR